MHISHSQKHTMRVFLLSEQLSPIMWFRDLGSFFPLGSWHSMHQQLMGEERWEKEYTFLCYFGSEVTPPPFFRIHCWGLVSHITLPRSKRVWEIEFLAEQLLPSNSSVSGKEESALPRPRTKGLVGKVQEHIGKHILDSNWGYTWYVYITEITSIDNWLHY